MDPLIQQNTPIDVPAPPIQLQMDLKIEVDDVPHSQPEAIPSTGANAIQKDVVQGEIANEKREISEEQKESVRDFVSLFDHTRSIPVEGLTSTYNTTVTLDRDHELSKAINALNPHESITQKDLATLIQRFDVDLSDKYPEFGLKNEPKENAPAVSEDTAPNKQSNIAPEDAASLPPMSDAKTLDASDKKELAHSAESSASHAEIDKPAISQKASVDSAIQFNSVPPSPDKAPPSGASLDANVSTKTPSPEAPKGEPKDEPKDEPNDKKKTDESSAKPHPVSGITAHDILGIGAIANAVSSLSSNTIGLLKQPLGKFSETVSNFVNTSASGKLDAFATTRDAFESEIESSSSKSPILDSFLNDTISKMADIRSAITSNIDQIKNGSMTDGTKLNDADIRVLTDKTEDLLSDYSLSSGTLVENIPNMTNKQKESTFKELKDGEDLMAEIGEDDSLEGNGQLKSKAQQISEAIKMLLDQLTKLFKRDNELNEQAPAP